MYKKTDSYHVYDFGIIIIYLILVLIGWFCIYSTANKPDVNINIFIFHTRPGLQIIWIISSLFIAFLLLKIDRNWYELFGFIIYTISIVLLVVTIFFAKPIKGSCSWLAFGGIKIQPVEFAKFATALAVAKAMSRYKFSISKKKDMLAVSILIFLPIMLIFLQKELGSSLVFLSFFLVFYREGMSSKIVFIGFFFIFLSILIVRYPLIIVSDIHLGKLLGMISIIVSVIIFLLLNNFKKKLKYLKYLLYAIFAIVIISIYMILFTHYNVNWVIFFLFSFAFFYFLFFFIKVMTPVYLFAIIFLYSSLFFIYSSDCIFNKLLKPYQKNRIQVTLGVLNSPSGVGYNVNQSIIAIGSGGLFGKGYMKGTQTQLKYVPEQETDFIFCTICEEIGFVGSILVLILFFILIIRLINLAEKQQFSFSRIYGYSVVSIIFSHFVINVGMVLGIVPVIGIPLPFFSYGGSSLLSFTILLFIFLKIDTSKRMVKFYKKGN